jgi:hypothetical protein
MTKRKTSWLVYVAVLTLFVIVGELSNLLQGATPTAITLANWVLTLVLLTADWGYALQKSFGARRYWQAAFWIVLFATAVMLVPVAFSGTEAIVFTAALLALVVPAYVAAFLYAYRSPGLWISNEERPA